MEDNNYKFSHGALPYHPPDFTIDESKKMTIDKFGNLANAKPEKSKGISLNFIRNTFLLILSALLLFSLFRLVFHFTPERWQNEKLRPLVIYSLKNQTDINDYQDAISNWIRISNNSESFADTDDLFGKFEKKNKKYNLYFKTEKEVDGILGEANPYGYALPEMPQTDNDDNCYRAYYCYGDEDNAKWIIIKYVSDRAVTVVFR